MANNKVMESDRAKSNGYEQPGAEQTADNLRNSIDMTNPKLAQAQTDKGTGAASAGDKASSGCKPGEKTVIDIKGQYGSDEGFLQKFPQEQRERFNLPKDADASRVFQAMGKETMDIYHDAHKAGKAAILKAQGLSAEDFNLKNVTAKIVDQTRKDLNMPTGSLNDLEKAMYKKLLADNNNCKLQVDVD